MCLVALGAEFPLRVRAFGKVRRLEQIVRPAVLPTCPLSQHDQVLLPKPEQVTHLASVSVGPVVDLRPVDVLDDGSDPADPLAAIEIG